MQELESQKRVGELVIEFREALPAVSKRKQKELMELLTPFAKDSSDPGDQFF